MSHETKMNPPEDNDEDLLAEEESDGGTLAKVLHLLPVQDAPKDGHGKELQVKRGRGRPRKVEKMLTKDALVYHAEIAELKQKYVDKDTLVQAIDGGADSTSILNHIKAGVAREAASLAFERVETEKRGRDTSMISSRRIDALKKIAEIELKLRELEAESINLSGEKAQKLFALWVEGMKEVGTEVMPPEMLDLFLSRFAAFMETWEEKAEQQLLVKK